MKNTAILPQFVVDLKKIYADYTRVVHAYFLLHRQQSFGCCYVIRLYLDKF